MTEIHCVRCGQERPGVAAPPFRNELGERVQREICQGCWSEWLFRQTQLINHYGLDVRESAAREFLLKNLRAFLFGEEMPAG
ncbi:MAG: oxidative damage protection protein [Gemmatimonadota bacterium]